MLFAGGWLPQLHQRSESNRSGNEACMLLRRHAMLRPCSLDRSAMLVDLHQQG
jgi:hypothetical protein